MRETQKLIVAPIVTGAVRSVLPGLLIIAGLSLVLFVGIQRAVGREERLVAGLQTALDEVKTIRGLLPICAYCKKIRTDEGAWDKIEYYLARNTDATFSHGICPDCETHVYQEMGLDPD